MHFGWAAVAAGAFWLGAAGDGSSGRATASADPEAGGVPEPRTARGGPGGGSRPTDAVSPRSGPRDAAEPDGLSGAFDLFSADGGVDGLATQAVQDRNPVMRRLAFARLLEAMTPENAGEIRERLLELGAGRSEMRDFHYSYGAIAGGDAFDLAAASEENDLGATLAGWAAARPEEAMAMFDSLPDALAGQRGQLAERLVEGLADRDPARATEFVLRLAAEGTGDTDDMIRMVGHEMLRGGDLDGAARWSENLPAGGLRSAAMDRIADRYARRDPEGAAAWVEGLADQDDAARAISEVGGEWAERDPVAAVGWLEGLPEGRGQAAGLRSAFGDWEDSDPQRAAQYLMDMPASAQRDAAVAGFSRGYAWQDPQTAIAWAEDIANPELRQQTLTRAARAYIRRDPQGGLAWLEGSDLPESAREEVLGRRR